MTRQRLENTDEELLPCSRCRLNPLFGIGRAGVIMCPACLMPFPEAAPRKKAVPKTRRPSRGP